VNSPPPKPEVILTNFFAEPTVLLVPITSRDVLPCVCMIITKVCTCQKLKFAFLLLEYCKIRECYAVANAFTIRNMHSLLLYMKRNLKYHKAGLTPTTSVTSTAISSVKMAIGHKSLTNLRSEMIFLQGKPVFYIFLPSVLLTMDT
jgi:hypothetical protein